MRFPSSIFANSRNSVYSVRLPHFEHRRTTRIAAATLVLLAFGRLAFGATWYIKPDGTGDAPTIQAGVDAASSGDVVLVAAGNYAATTVIDINGTPTTVCVAIGKNITLVSESGPASTTIASPSAKIAIYLHDVGMATTVSGFRVQTSFTGYACTDAPAQPSQWPPYLARGIHCDNGTVLISNNHVVANDVGIELFSSSAVITGNTIEMAIGGLGGPLAIRWTPS